MISRRIPSGKDKHGQAKRHDFRKLGNYCRDASHAGEKCLMSWHEGCLAPDYDLALEEIIATQTMNSRAKSDRTYHLMVSFRPEDEAKLTPEDYEKIELAMAEAMGLSDHQRVCAIHKNTNNLHMHVAYNLIRPDKFTMNEPYFDQRNRDAACRTLEKEFGLVVDNGIEISNPLEPKINQRAAAMEAHSGERSFQSFALERRQRILAEMAKAQSWSDAHRILAAHGITIKSQANGLVLANIEGKETMKASAFDRSMSKAKLIGRFGDYEQPDQSQEKETKAGDPKKSGKTKYDKKPLQHRSPERDELYKSYQAALVEKITRIDAEKARSQAAFDGLKERWLRVKPQAGRRRVYGMMLGIQRRNMARAKAGHQERLAAIKKDYLWHNWNGFLQSQAEAGDKVALAVLRSQEERRGGKVAVKTSEPEKIFLTVSFADKAAAKKAGAKWDRAEKKWYTLEGADLDKFTAWILPPDRPAGGEKSAETIPEATVLSREKLESRKKESGKPPEEKVSPVVRLSRLAWQEKERMKAGVADKSHFAGFQMRIDNRGVVIISLAAGGTIRDAGNKLHFSPDEDTCRAARLYAMAKFGQEFSEKDNSIKRQEHGQWKNILKPHLGVLKESARNGLRTLSQIPLALGRKQPEVFLPGHAHTDLER